MIKYLQLYLFFLDKNQFKNNIKRLLNLINLFEAYIFYIYKVTKVIIVYKNKHLIPKTFQIMMLYFENLDNS